MDVPHDSMFTFCNLEGNPCVPWKEIIGDFSSRIRTTSSYSIRTIPYQLKYFKIPYTVSACTYAVRDDA
jgi:hypothetical protein